jgi:hypothetical protein
MSYPKEHCLFFLQNTELLEKTEEIVEAVDAVLFKAINARIEKRIKGLGGWKGWYGMVSGNAAKDEETSFAPVAWPENKDCTYRVAYDLGETDSDKNDYWLSSAFGVNKTELCFYLWFDTEHGLSKGEVARQTLVLATGNAEVKAAGFKRNDDGLLYLPFSFNAEKAAVEFPLVRLWLQLTG